MKWAKEKKKYDGEWKNGLMHGNAKFTYFDEKKVDSKLGQAYGQKAKGSNGFIQKNLQIQ